jgi:hypothetical protein
MPKQLQSKTQTQIQKSIKNIETFDLPIDPTLPPHFETKEEWLEEMAQEEAQLTLEQKQQAEQQGKAQLERMRKLHPKKLKKRDL